MDLASQFAWLTETCRDYYSEVEGLEFYQGLIQGEWGLGYVRSSHKSCIASFASGDPKELSRLAVGFDDMCMLHAAEMNRAEGGSLPQITCVEPFPSAALRQRTTEIHLIPELCQSVPASVFAGLSAGDFLFVDSSHAVNWIRR